MLKEQDALRILDYKGRQNKEYVYGCLKCNKEIRVYKARLTKHTGLCGVCSKRSTENKHRGEPFRWLYNRLKYRAKKRNIPVTLTYKEFVGLTEIPCCRYCNSYIMWIPHSGRKRGETGINLDRHNSSKGYSLDNVSVCCGPCNVRKNAWFDDMEYQAVNDFMRTWRKLDPNNKKELELVIAQFDPDQWKFELC